MALPPQALRTEPRSMPPRRLFAWSWDLVSRPVSSWQGLMHESNLQHQGIDACLDDRKALSKKQRFAEDKAREIIEEQHESVVLRELPAIIQYCEERQPSLANSQILL